MSKPTISPTEWRRARRWWRAGLGTDEIARRLRCTRQNVSGYAMRHGWPPRLVRPRVEDVAVAFIAEPVRVRCHACLRHRTMTLAAPVACVCGARAEVAA